MKRTPKVLLTLIAILVFNLSNAQTPFTPPSPEPDGSKAAPVIWMQWTNIGGLWFWMPYFNV